MNENDLKNFIYALNLKLSYSVSDRYYIINDRISILIEQYGYGNVFIYDDNKTSFSDRYISVETIDELINIIKEKTNINLNIFLRKQKIENILKYKK